MNTAYDPQKVWDVIDAIQGLPRDVQRRRLGELDLGAADRQRIEELITYDWPGDWVDEKLPELDGFTSFRWIAGGGMGVVWRAEDRQFERSLAIKVMQAKLLGEPDMLRRFVDEARITGQLTHPSIVPIHAMGKLPDDRPYYTMKLIEGNTLADLLQDRPDLPFRRMEFVQIFNQVCQAMAFAHGRGIIHRDLKPRNIMVGAHGEVQVMDWGCAKALRTVEGPQARVGVENNTESSEYGDRTLTGMELGTRNYMSPEQVAGSALEVDQRSDVFGLGAILCQILTGDPPYKMVDGSPSLEAQLDGTFARLRSCGADSTLIQLTEQCLSADKAHRLADAGEVANAVAAYQAEVQERLQQEKLERERQQVRTAEERRRRRVWMGLATAVMVAAGLLVVGLILRYQKVVADQLAEERGKLAEERAEITLDVLKDFSAVAEDWLARQPEMTSEHDNVLNTLLVRFEQLLERESTQPKRRAALAEAYQKAGSIRYRLTRSKEAVGHFEKALAIYVELDRAAPVEHKLKIAECHNQLGLALAASKSERIRAENEFRRAIRICEEMNYPTHNPEFRREEAAGHLNLGILLTNETARLKEAVGACETAIELYSDLFERDGSNRELLFGLARSEHSLGGALRRSGMRTKAKKTCEKADGHYATLVALSPLPMYRQNQAANLNMLVRVLRELNLDELDQAQKYGEQALRISQRLESEFPGVVEVRIGLAETYINFGNLIHSKLTVAALEESLNWYTDAEKILKLEIEKNSGLAIVKDQLVNVYWGRAAARDRLGRPKEAEMDWDMARHYETRPPRKVFLACVRDSTVGHHETAIMNAEAFIEMDMHVIDNSYFDCACVYSRAAAVEKDEIKRQKYIKRAVELLGKAEAKGYENIARIRKDYYLCSLRDNKDFETLVRKMEAAQAK